MLIRVLSKAKLDNRRYSGLNLTNLGNPDKNTIEFRMSNGTLDLEVIKQNVFLYASIIECARASVLSPEKVQSKLDKFYKTDVSEESKVESFLNLIFENEESKDIYRQRWLSVKKQKFLKIMINVILHQIDLKEKSL